MSQSERADDFAEEVSREAIALRPNEAADPQAIVDECIPQSIRDRYECYSYRSAAVVLSKGHKALFDELVTALDDFTLTTEMIRTAGGNESAIPKLLTSRLRPLGWHETIIQGIFW
jgi:hypothetical protein